MGSGRGLVAGEGPDSRNKFCLSARPYGTPSMSMYPHIGSAQAASLLQGTAYDLIFGLRTSDHKNHVDDNPFSASATLASSIAFSSLSSAAGNGRKLCGQYLGSTADREVV